jgi:hypothetical protein
VSRRWTDGLRREVKGRDQQYLDLLLVRSNSREYVDSIAGMTQAQVHRAAMLFCNADLDGDGALQLDEFRRHLVARFGVRFSGDVVFEALCRKADLNQDGLIDFNEWLVFNETRVGGMTFGRVKGGLLDESVAADANPFEGQLLDLHPDPEVILPRHPAAVIHRDPRQRRVRRQPVVRVGDDGILCDIERALAMHEAGDE